MRINTDSVRAVSSMLYLSDARNAFGRDGEEALPILLDRIRVFFQYLPPDYIPGGVMFVQEVKSGNAAPIFCGSQGLLKQSLVETELPGLVESIGEGYAIVARATSSGNFDVLITEALPEAADIAATCIVFVNIRGEDRFHIGDQTRVLPPFVKGISSNFAEPTISDLAEALRVYGQEAKRVTCPILADVWEFGRDGPRLVFKNKPEATMRSSLSRFLSVRLGPNASVRPEHNTDETKPVDIVVNWFGMTSRALIEIKWLGKSMSQSSSEVMPRFTEYSDARAREGYDQLADYLDREATSDPKAALRGYLVVFDGRRRGVTAPDSPITYTDGEHYRDREVSYGTDHAATRVDMESPIRYFLEARKSCYLGSDAG
jgi:hypothetical protein